MKRTETLAKIIAIFVFLLSTCGCDSGLPYRVEVATPFHFWKGINLPADLYPSDLFYEITSTGAVVTVTFVPKQEVHNEQ